MRCVHCCDLVIACAAMFESTLASLHRLLPVEHIPALPNGWGSPSPCSPAKTDKAPRCFQHHAKVAAARSARVKLAIERAPMSSPESSLSLPQAHTHTHKHPAHATATRITNDLERMRHAVTGPTASTQAPTHKARLANAGGDGSDLRRDVHLRAPPPPVARLLWRLLLRRCIRLRIAERATR